MKNARSFNFITTDVKTTLAGAIICFVAMVFFASVIEVPALHPIPGWIEPDGGFIEMRSDQTARIVGLNYRVGDFISEGDVVASLVSDRRLSNGQSASTVSLSSLQEELDTYETREQLLQETFLATNDRIDRAEDVIRNRIRRLAVQESLAVRRFAIEQERLRQIETLLNAGRSTRTHFHQQEIATLGAESALAEFQDRLSSLEAELVDVESQRNFARAEFELNRQSMVAERLRVAREIDAFSIEHSFAVVAPEDMILTGIRVPLGDIVQSGEVVVTGYNAHSELVAVLLVDPIIVSDISAGDTLSLEFEETPDGEKLRLVAQVRSVGSDLFRPEELDAPFSIEGPAYRVEMVIISESEADLDVLRRLRPAQQVSAMRERDSGSLLVWAFGQL